MENTQCWNQKQKIIDIIFVNGNFNSNTAKKIYWEKRDLIDEY